MGRPLRLRETLRDGGAIAARVAPIIILPYVSLNLVAASLHLGFEYWGLSVKATTNNVTIVSGMFGVFLAAYFYGRANKGVSSAQKDLGGARLFFASLLVNLILLLFVGVFAIGFWGLLGALPYQYEDSLYLALEDLSTLPEAFETLVSGFEGWLLIALVSLATLFLVWFSVRLFCFGVATVLEGKIRIFRTWAWTKGQALKLTMGSVIIIVLPLLFALVAMVAAELPLYNVLGFSVLNPITAWERALSDLLYALALLPFFLLGHGFAVATYNRLRPQGETIDQAVRSA